MDISKEEFAIKVNDNLNALCKSIIKYYDNAPEEEKIKFYNSLDFNLSDEVYGYKPYTQILFNTLKKYTPIVIKIEDNAGRN